MDVWADYGRWANILYARAWSWSGDRGLFKWNVLELIL